MSDSANVYSLPGADSVHICHVNKTETNLRTELEECQVAIETDTKKLAFKDQSDGYHTCVCEDTNGKVAIGNGTTAARSELDLYGAMYQTKTLTAAENAIREAVGSRTLYSGSTPVTALRVPVVLTDHVMLDGPTTLIIIPKYTSGMTLAGWVGDLVIHGIESDAENTSLAIYRGHFDVDWWNDPVSGTTQFLTEINNYNSNIGFTSGSKDLNVFCPIEPEHGQMAQDCGYIVVEYTGSYQVQLYYRFEGAVQVPGDFTKY